MKKSWKYGIIEVALKRKNKGKKEAITMKKKVVKIIGILLLVAIILFLAITIPKTIIIQKHGKKLEEYQKVSNFYAKIK